MHTSTLMTGKHATFLLWLHENLDVWDNLKACLSDNNRRVDNTVSSRNELFIKGL